MESYNNVSLKELTKRVKQVTSISELSRKFIGSLTYIKGEFGLQPNILVLLHLLFHSRNCIAHPNHELAIKLDALENHSIQLSSDNGSIPEANLDALRNILVTYHRNRPLENPKPVSYSFFILQ